MRRRRVEARFCALHDYFHYLFFMLATCATRMLARLCHADCCHAFNSFAALAARHIDAAIDATICSFCRFAFDADAFISSRR